MKGKGGTEADLESVVVFNLNSVRFDDELIQVTEFQSTHFGDFGSDGNVCSILVKNIESDIFSELNEAFVVYGEVPGMIFNFCSFERNGEPLKGTKTIGENGITGGP